MCAFAVLGKPRLHLVVCIALVLFDTVAESFTHVISVRAVSMVPDARLCIAFIPAVAVSAAPGIILVVKLIVVSAISVVAFADTLLTIPAMILRLRAHCPLIAGLACVA